MNGFRARLDYVLKHNQLVNKLFRYSVSAIMRVWGWFIPMDKKMIVFSGHSRKYNDSPRAIYEYMIAHPEYKDYKFVWALEDPENVAMPGPAIKIKADTPQYFKYTLKAKYWITCVNIERSLHYKKKKCIYLNTWHGVAFNCIGNAAGGRQDYDFSNIDLFCYESEYQKNIFKRDFNVREDALIPTGLPRNDSLYHVSKEEVAELKKKLGIPLDKKVIMYAPTWRDSYDKGASYAIKPPMNLEKWESELKDDYVLLFRTHAYTTKLLGVRFNDFCRDFTSYPIINDLFKVSDILISDYSACIADYSILERPIICFAYDYNAYKLTRGLYIDFSKEMPNGIFQTEDKVINHILTMDYDAECLKTKKMIKDKFTYLGGAATEFCVKKIFDDKMKHIVFGRNVGNSLGQIRSLGEAGLNPILVWIGEESEVLRSSKYLSESYSFPTISEGIDFMINHWGNEDGLKHVLTVDSDGLVAELNKRYTTLSKYFYFFNAGSDNRLSWFMEKEKLCQLAKKYGLLTPNSEIVKVGELPKVITYPLLSKAVDSFSASWKNCVRICWNQEDLLDFYQVVDVQMLLLQNYIKKKNEFILQGIAINRGKDVFIPIEGSYYRIPDGYFGTYLFFNGITEIGENLVKPVKAMLEEIGYEGVFEAEFIIDDEDNYIFLEINFRHTLWNHTFTNMGLNFCEIWSKAIVNRKFPEVKSISTDKRHVLIHEFVDFLWYAKTGKVNIFKWILDFLQSDSYVIWDRQDLMPFITYLKTRFSKHIR